jgi:hypothetical protein
MKLKIIITIIEITTIIKNQKLIITMAIVDTNTKTIFAQKLEISLVIKAVIDCIAVSIK